MLTGVICDDYHLSSLFPVFRSSGSAQGFTPTSSADEMIKGGCLRDTSVSSRMKRPGAGGGEVQGRGMGQEQELLGQLHKVWTM